MGILSADTKDNLETHRKDRQEMRSAVDQKDAAEMYFSLASKLPVGIVVHDNENIILANPQSCEILGWNGPSDLIGRSVNEILSKESQQPYWYSYDKLIKHEANNSSAKRIKLQHKEGQVVEVYSFMAPVEIVKGIVAQVVFVDHETLRNIAGVCDSKGESSSDINEKINRPKK